MGVLKSIRDELERQDWGWFNVIRDALIWIIDQIQEKLEDWLGWVVDWVWNWKNWIEKVVGWAIDNWNKLVRFFGDLWDRALKVLNDFYWGLKAWVEAWWSQITNFFFYDLPEIWDKLWSLIGTVSDWANGIIADASTFLSRDWPFFNRYVMGSLNTLFSLVDFFKKGLEWLENKINQVSSDFQNFLQTSWQPFTTNTTNFINALNQAVFQVIIPSLQSAWEILERIPSAILDVLNQPRKLREEEEGIRRAILTHMKEITRGKTPLQIEAPPELSKTLHSSPTGILELLFFYLVQVLGFNLYGLYRWITTFPGFQRDRDELPEPRAMSLRELMDSVDHVMGSIQDLIAQAVGRIVVVHPDGSTSPLAEAEMRDPEVVAETPFGVPGMTYLLYTVEPHGFYIVLSPFIGGYKFIYDEERRSWKIEWASAEECRRLMDKAGFKIISFGVT